MIEPTEADIGRRVIYSHPALKHKGRGKLVGIEDDHTVRIQFDGDSGRAGPLRCGLSCLFWATDGAAA